MRILGNRVFIKLVKEDERESGLQVGEDKSSAFSKGEILLIGDEAKKTAPGDIVFFNKTRSPQIGYKDVFGFVVEEANVVAIL